MENSNAPREEDYGSFADYDDALINHQVESAINERMTPAEWPSENSGADEPATYDHRGLGDLEDPNSGKRVETVNQIENYLNKAAKARTSGDHKAAFHAEQMATSYQNDLEKMALPPAVTRAERASVEQLETDIESVMEPGRLQELEEQHGQEKILSDTRTHLNNFNRLSDGTTFYVIKGDSATHGKSAKAEEILKVEVPTQELADELRREIAFGENIYDSLMSRHLIDSPEEGQSQAEYEATRKKQGALPKYLARMPNGRKK